MKNPISIRPYSRGYQVLIDTPYNSDFVEALKDGFPSRRRRWDPRQRFWIITVPDGKGGDVDQTETAIRSMIKEFFR